MPSLLLLIILLKPHNHLLHHSKSCRAIIDILFMDIRIIRPFSFGEMRKTCTVCGAYFVDGTFIICQVEELAGFGFIDEIIITIFSQPLFFKFIRRLIEMLRDPFQIRWCKRRRHFFTAIGAAQAIHFLPHFLGHHRCDFVDRRRRNFFRFI